MASQDKVRFQVETQQYNNDRAAGVAPQQQQSQQAVAVTPGRDAPPDHFAAAYHDPTVAHAGPSYDPYGQHQMHDPYS
jgi:hypothetical protein